MIKEEKEIKKEGDKEIQIEEEKERDRDCKALHTWSRLVHRH